MPPRFDAHLRQLHSSVDAEMGERLRLLFLKDGRADLDRENVEIVAVLRTDDVAIAAAHETVGSVLPRIAGLAGMVRFDPFKYPDLKIGEDDKIVALDRAGEPMFRVMYSDRSTHRRPVLYLERS